MAGKHRCTVKRIMPRAEHSIARCTCDVPYGALGCPMHTPDLYAAEGAKHRRAVVIPDQRVR